MVTREQCLHCQSNVAVLDFFILTASLATPSSEKDTFDSVDKENESQEGEPPCPSSTMMVVVCMHMYHNPIGRKSRDFLDRGFHNLFGRRGGDFIIWGFHKGTLIHFFGIVLLFLRQRLTMTQNHIIVYNHILFSRFQRRRKRIHNIHAIVRFKQQRLTSPKHTLRRCRRVREMRNPSILKTTDIIPFKKGSSLCFHRFKKPSLGNSCCGQFIRYHLCLDVGL
mmetsp:Transcript_32267/g.74125  ORF Transcript_32267/g.74125 Transcript_32267/m.74125 type:complete len:223 (+) Transcript_32267:502-1170(+)